MVAPEHLYGVLVTVLLLVALGVSLPVLAGIVRDGLKRHRKRRRGEMDRYTDDQESDRLPGDPPADAHAVDDRRGAACRQCGTTNDPAFTYCRRCLTPL